jgi:hypothetical protein
MDGNEDLAAIPSERLVLTLLQELASRVKRLEDADRARREISAPAPLTQKRFAYNLLNEDALNTNGTVTPRETSCEWASHDKYRSTTDTRYVCPYGFLLDGEDMSDAVMKPKNRLENVSDPDIAKQLRQLGGIAQVPADFRFELTNFWTLDAAVQKDVLNSAIDFLNIVALKGGSYWITDHDLKSNQVLYEYWSASENTLEVPVVNQNPVEEKTRSSPWRRIM